MKINSELRYLIHTVPIFENLENGELEVLSNFLVLKELPMEGLVCKEGQHANFLCFVTAGQLDVSKKIEDSEVNIATIEEGGTMGEMALIDGLTRSATVRAKVASTILLLRREEFDQILEKHPEIGIKILKGIARVMSLNLRKASAQITAYMTMTQ